MSWQLEEEDICSLRIFSVKELLNISRSAGCLWELRLRIVIINKAKPRSFEARVQQIFKWWICKIFIQIRLFSVRPYHFVSHLFKLNNKLQRFEGEIQSYYLNFVAYILSNGSMSYERRFRVICPLFVCLPVRKLHPKIAPLMPDVERKYSCFLLWWDICIQLIN